ncbi:armadillo-type protein [Mycena pura]|uniref:Armadillo-type protein n=1 Tax=Mycena pura TaxID=153505 RepID=A0AAD6YV32_9AGAR|nr:armadillo-type protein [Mycena pura]
MRGRGMPQLPSPSWCRDAFGSPRRGSGGSRSLGGNITCSRRMPLPRRAWRPRGDQTGAVVPQGAPGVSGGVTTASGYPVYSMCQQAAAAKLSLIMSWWSDSNQPGATVNLHALSKPLMRVLYHRQAREFIRIHQGVRLSKDTMDIFASYLRYKYISAGTKTLLLEELTTRATTEWTQDASVILEILDGHLLTSLLQSPVSSVKSLTCYLLGYLVTLELASSAIEELEPPGQLMAALLYDQEPKVSQSAMFALSKLSLWSKGAETVVNAKVLGQSLVFLNSTDARTREYTCHTATWAAISEINPCVQLIALVGSAIYALSQLSLRLGRAESVDNNLNALRQTMVHLLYSADTWTRAHTSHILGNLVSHETTSAAILVMQRCLYLVSLLSRELEGAQYVVHAKALEHTLTLLNSPDTETQAYACEMLGHIASHAATSAAILVVNPCLRLVSLLNLSQGLEGAQSVVQAKALEHTLALLNSPDTETRTYACEMLGHIASHAATSAAILVLNPCLRLVSLLSLSQGLEGAQSVVHAKALQHTLALLNSPDTETQSHACEMLGYLASHEVTSVAVLVMD